MARDALYNLRVKKDNGNQPLTFLVKDVSYLEIGYPFTKSTTIQRVTTIVTVQGS